MNWKTILRHLIGVGAAWGSMQLGIPPGTEHPAAIASYAITEKLLKPVFRWLGEEDDIAESAARRAPRPVPRRRRE